MIRSADVVVIGSGAFGSAIAYALARRTTGRIVVVDREAIASQTSPRAAGLTAQLRSTDLMSRLAMRAVELFAQFEHDTGQPLDIVRSGSLRIACSAEDAQRLETDAARGQDLGLDTRIISPEDAHRRHPFLQPTHIVAALITPTDVYLEPSQVALGYATAAAGLGVNLLPHTPVTGLVVRDGKIEGVETDRGTIDALVVVDAAGAWARGVAAMAGFEIPMVPTRHQLFITEPLDGVNETLPILRFIDAAVYVRPCWGGLMMGGYESAPLQYRAAQLDPPFDIRDTELDLEVLRGLARRVADQLPVLQDAPIRLVRGGLPTLTVDGQHIVGEVPGAAGLFVASGCNVAGLSVAPALGEELAAWIATGEPSASLSPMAITRFGDRWRDDDAIREAARVQYVNFYRHGLTSEAAGQWPGVIHPASDPAASGT